VSLFKDPSLSLNMSLRQALKRSLESAQPETPVSDTAQPVPKKAKVVKPKEKTKVSKG
jgi:hypothetical protein